MEKDPEKFFLIFSDNQEEYENKILEVVRDHQAVSTEFWRINNIFFMLMGVIKLPDIDNCELLR